MWGQVEPSGDVEVIASYSSADAHLHEVPPLPPPEAMPAWQAIPLLAMEWPQDPEGTATKLKQFVAYHLKNKHTLTVSLYRCALLQLMRGYGVSSLSDMGLSEKQIREETGT